MEKEKKTKCLIGCGKCSHFYIYILGSSIFNSLKDIVLKYSQTLEDKHIIQGLSRYIMFMAAGAGFLYYFKKILNSLNKKSNFNIDYSKDINSYESSNSTKLIYNDIKFSLMNKNDSGSLLFIVSIIYFFYIEILKILDFFGFYYLEFWTFDVVFLLLLMNIYYPKSTYKHQTFSMIFIAVINTILLIGSSVLNIYYDNENKKKNIYEYKGSKACIFIMIIYCNLTFLIYYSRMQVKILTDENFISPYKIIISIGIVGFLFELIIFIISFILDSKSKCQKENYVNIYCYLNSSDFFSNFNNKTLLNVFKEIILSLLYILFSFGGLVCELFIIKYLNPNYVLMSDNIYFESIKINKFIYNELDGLKKNKNILIQFIIIQITQILELIGCLIYLELIELRFCGLNINLKRAITARSEEETIESLTSSDDNRKSLDNNDGNIIELNERKDNSIDSIN